MTITILIGKWIKAIKSEKYKVAKSLAKQIGDTLVSDGLGKFEDYMLKVETVFGLLTISPDKEHNTYNINLRHRHD